MPYIGKTTDGFGVRNRFVYLASSGDTSVSGADANGATLTFTDGAYVDVYLNGVLLKPTTDYNTSTANTIAGLSALNTNDEVTVVVYDVFTVADMVSATSGGTFSGNVTFGAGIEGGVVFNDDSADVDFRVESNDQTHMLFVDGGINQVGVGVVPNDGWNTNFLGIDINNQGGIHHYTSADLTVENNAYFDSSNAWKYKRDGYASRLNFVNASGNVKFSSAASGSADGAISFLDNIEMEHSSGDLKVTRGDIFFAGSGKGINLGVTSNTDSNTLDDYEEGTWTPTMTNITLSTAEGQYIKVGKLVTAHFNVVLPTTSTTNTAVISSLPFNTAVVNQYGGGFFSYQNTSYDMLTLYNQGETYCTILNGANALNNSNISTKQFLGTIVYYSA